MKNRFAVVIFLSVFCLPLPLWALDLSLNTGDILLELRADGGYHLFIRKKPDIASVLLTESTRDPNLMADNFAYRAGEWNPINGDEIRLLDGVPISRESGIFSLISSTPVDHPMLGQAFHIYMPYALYYGHPHTRHGRVFITDGTFINIRAFALPFGDYRGPFRDNPFVLEAIQEPSPDDPEGGFMPEAVEAFREISRVNSGDFMFTEDSEEITKIIRDVLEREKGKNLDLVICIDTTGSMRPHIDGVRRELVTVLEEMLSYFPSFRIGMVQFKDYNDTYLTRLTQFTNDFARFQRALNAIRPHGGGDIPEAVFEALYDGATRFPWEAEARVMILIGDAPPHPRPRGRVTRDMTFRAIEEREITIHTILLPHP
ncbi:MAG: VWA domain-containing protein [Treponema sp.]|nr:VWA domain-containing protein [Treponema sp.]